MRPTTVPKADFVVMNPTHYAVALKYDDATMGAPQVVSKGTDLLAFKIREVAQAHGVPVLQSPMLARALYAYAELEQPIPATKTVSWRDCPIFANTFFIWLRIA